MWGMQDHARLDFFGSPNNLVDGVFSPPPIVNARFTARGSLREPVIIVPGIMGSRLNRVSDGEEVWPKTLKMSNPLTPADDYLDELKLDTDGIEFTASEMNPSSVINKEFTFVYYKNLVDSFKQQGYVESSTLLTFPYDWRLDIATEVARFDDLVQLARSHSPTGKVNIIAHSLGGLLTKEYLSSLQDTSFVDKVIFAGVPNLGAPLAYKVLNYGDDMGLKWFAFGLNQEETKDFSQNMPSVYELLPSREYIKRSGSYVFDLRNGRDPLSYASTAQLMKENGRNERLLDAADQFHQERDLDALNISSSTAFYNIIGCGNTNTIGGFNLYEKSVDVPEFSPRLTNGDGTVPLISSKSFPNASRTYFASYKETGADHTGLVSSMSTVELIKNLIDGFPDNVSLGIYGDEFACVGLGRTFLISSHSPVELHVYDPEGRHLGPINNDTLNLDIPNSSYFTIEDNHFALVPEGDNYRIVLDANATGTFSLGIETLYDSLPENKITYLDVPLQSDQTNAELNFSGAQNNLNLELDQNGDGVVDSVIAPTAVLSGASSTDILPPDVAIVSPEEKDYPRLGMLPIIVNATDTESGLAFIDVLLDGDSLGSSTTIDLFYEHLGNHVLSVQTSDRAGNPRALGSHFQIIATPESTISDIERSFAFGWISKKGVKEDLIRLLKNAIKVQKRIEVLEEKLSDGKKVIKRIERLEERLDKILGKRFLGEIEKRKNSGLLNEQAYQLLKEDIEWMLAE